LRIDRRLETHFDWITLAFALALVTLSVLLLYSASLSRVEYLTGIYLKQLFWIGLALLVMLGVLYPDYQVFCRHPYLLYSLAIGGLIAVLLFGRVINGAQRWLEVGPWRFQASELIKPILILVLARHFSAEKEKQHENSLLTLRDLPIPLLLVGLPFILIVKQPDLSTAMVLLAVLCVMVGVIGLEQKTLLGICILGICTVPLAWQLLAEYQRERIWALLNPQSDLLGIGYHSWQSKIAIGSGGLWGKGFLDGTQSRLNFLPEKHTDFIFAILGEEMGFLGVFVVIILFSGLILQGLTTAYRARDRLGALIATGVVTLLAGQAFLNIGMTIGLLPIVGLPLPLLSYGGSSLITTFFYLGLLMNIRMRRFKF
jgi:rod shape determining protein RodA